MPPPQTLGHGALHAAVDGLHVDVVALLLSLGASPNLRTHVSTVGGLPKALAYFPTASMFIIVGVNVCTPCTEQLTRQTPLHFLAARGSATSPAVPAILQCLLEAGAEACARDKVGTQQSHLFSCFS